MNLNQWHVYIVDLEPRIGSKPGKQRPCLCIQPSELSKLLNSAVVLPLTTQITTEDAFPLRVRIPKGICGLEKDNDVVVDQILAWDKVFFKNDLGPLPEALRESVRTAIRDFLDL